jgi:hypothetical protein
LTPGLAMEQTSQAAERRNGAKELRRAHRRNRR